MKSRFRRMDPTHALWLGNVRPPCCRVVQLGHSRELPPASANTANDMTNSARIEWPGMFPAIRRLNACGEPLRVLSRMFAHLVSSEAELSSRLVGFRVLRAAATNDRLQLETSGVCPVT